MRSVFVARLVCSDSACAAEAAAEAATLDELETLMCECGCALEVVGWPDWVDEPAEVVVLRARMHELRDAA
jgi:hypothetical protein